MYCCCFCLLFLFVFVVFFVAFCVPVFFILFVSVLFVCFHFVCLFPFRFVCSSFFMFCRFLFVCFCSCVSWLGPASAPTRRAVPALNRYTRWHSTCTRPCPESPLPSSHTPTPPSSLCPFYYYKTQKTHYYFCTCQSHYVMSIIYFLYDAILYYKTVTFICHLFLTYIILIK